MAFTIFSPCLRKPFGWRMGTQTAHELAVTARGIARAGEILAGQFTLVATNVPYLEVRQTDAVTLKAFC